MGPDPILAPTAWDFAIIAGLATPGLAKVTGDGVKLKWDDKKGYGISGSSATFTGRDVTRFSLKLRFAEGIYGLSSFEQRFVFYEQIIPTLQSALEGKQAVDFYHPAVSEPPINVTSVDIEHIHPLEQEGDTGIWFVVLDLKRHSKPVKALATPAGSKGNKTNKKAVDEADLEIANLNATLKSLENI